MPKAEHPFVKLARESVEAYLREQQLSPSIEITPEMREKAGVFVTITKHGSLRGCIGTYEATRSSVADEIIHNAIESATRDPRFPPVSPEELPERSYSRSVDILSKPVPVESLDELDPKKCGVIVECGDLRGLLLPDLEGVDTVERQIEICRQKAWIPPEEPVKVYRFEVRRYH